MLRLHNVQECNAAMQHLHGPRVQRCPSMVCRRASDECQLTHRPACAAAIIQGLGKRGTDRDSAVTQMNSPLPDGGFDAIRSEKFGPWASIQDFLGFSGNSGASRKCLYIVCIVASAHIYCGKVMPFRSSEQLTTHEVPKIPSISHFFVDLWKCTWHS